MRLFNLELPSLHEPDALTTKLEFALALTRLHENNGDPMGSACNHGLLGLDIDALKADSSFHVSS